MTKEIKSIEWKDGVVRIIDQTKLPTKFEMLDIKSFEDMKNAIRKMKIRGAPALGVAAAFGLVLGGRSLKSHSARDFLLRLDSLAREMLSLRPTAVNVSWALQRLVRVARENQSLKVEEIKGILLSQALKLAQEDAESNKRIAEVGNKFIKKGDSILTHCNTGSLATVSFGTALGIIRQAHDDGKEIHVFVTETRPRLQGAKLTMWELKNYDIPATLITDSMVAYFMFKKKIDVVVVGADRIALNGDVANKIGTYNIAVLAKEHGIPFYIAASLNTIDMNISSGSEIPIEERDESEVTLIASERITPKAVHVANPAFDVTPRQYVRALITDVGIIKPPYRENIKAVMRKLKRI